jgi:uncharacterized protein YybS (DUF2232 family)
VAQLLPGDSAKEILAGIVITSLIFMVSRFMPILGLFGATFIPLPILYFRVKLGRNLGSLVPLGALFAYLVVENGLGFDVLFFLELLLLGFTMGEAMERKWSIEKTILTPCVAVFVSAVLGVFIYANLSGLSFSRLVLQYIKSNLELSIALYRALGVPQETITAISASLDQISAVLAAVLPSLILVSLAFVAWACLLLARPLFRVKSMPYPDYGHLTHWKAQENLVWAVIGCGIFLFLPFKGLAVIGANGLILFLMVYFLQGISIVSYLFEKKNVPRFLRILIYIFIGLQQLALLLVIGMGFFDMWINFRKLNMKPDETP